MIDFKGSIKVNPQITNSQYNTYAKEYVTIMSRVKLILDMFNSEDEKNGYNQRKSGYLCIRNGMVHRISSLRCIDYYLDKHTGHLFADHERTLPRSFTIISDVII